MLARRRFSFNIRVTSNNRNAEPASTLSQFAPTSGIFNLKHLVKMHFEAIKRADEMISRSSGAVSQRLAVCGAVRR